MERGNEHVFIRDSKVARCTHSLNQSTQAINMCGCHSSVTCSNQPEWILQQALELCVLLREKWASLEYCSLDYDTSYWLLWRYRNVVLAKLLHLFHALTPFEAVYAEDLILVFRPNFLACQA